MQLKRGITLGLAAYVWMGGAVIAGERTFWVPLKPDPPPAVDGNLVEWHSIPGKIPLGASSQAEIEPENPTGSKDLSGELQLAWRQEGIYVAATVQGGPTSSTFPEDSIQFLFHTNRFRVEGSDSPKHPFLRLGLSPGRPDLSGDSTAGQDPEAVVFAPSGVRMEGARIAAGRREGGYTIEAFLPSQSIGITTQVGAAFGMDVGFSDSSSDDLPGDGPLTSGSQGDSTTLSRLSAAVLVQSDGRPVSLNHSQGVFAGVEIPVGETRSLSFSVPTWPSGLEPVLSFPARLDFPQPGGYTQAMKVSVNGNPLGLKRLLNKEETEERADGSLSSTAGAGGDLFTVDYSSDFDATDSHPIYALKRRDTRSSDFVFSASGLITAGTNEVLFDNSIRSPLTNALVIGRGRIEFRPPVPSKSEAGPPTGPIPRVAPRGLNRLHAEVSRPSTNVIRLVPPQGIMEVNSQFSTPDGRWQECSNDFFSFDREIVLQTESVLVRDTYTNLTSENLPLMHRHQIRRTPRQVWLAGLSPSGTVGSVLEPQNPTAFAVYDDFGLGLMALDDVFQVHINSFSTDEGIGIADNQLVIQPGVSYTAEWVILPTARPDYFDFVNATRRVRDVNFSIPGSFAFLRAHPDLTGQWSDQQLEDFARFKSAKYLCSTIDYPMIGARYPHGTSFQGLDHSARIAHIKRMHRLVPEAEQLVYFHCFIDVRDEAPEEYADARVLKGDGSQANYGHETDRIFFPTESNSFGRAVRKNVDLILGEIGADGVYWDELEYSAYHYHYGDPWDGWSADIDPQTFRISRLKSSVTLITQPWRVGLVKEILEKGPLIANGSPHTRTMAALHFPRFVETGSISACARAQLYTPIALGDHLTEQSEEDAYRVLLRALDYGCVYYWYNDMTVIPTHPHITSYMFPITPIELGPGYILGEERIITRTSGIFGWEDGSDHEVHVFDATGREVETVHPPTVASTHREFGKTWTEIRLAEHWSAAILRR